MGFDDLADVGVEQVGLIADFINEDMVAEPTRLHNGRHVVDVPEVYPVAPILLVTAKKQLSDLYSVRLCEIYLGIIGYRTDNYGKQI